MENIIQISRISRSPNGSNILIMGNATGLKSLKEAIDQELNVGENISTTLITTNLVGEKEKIQIALINFGEGD